MSKFRSFFIILPALAGVGGVILSITTGASSVQAAARNGEFHVTKECSQNKGQAGDFCTITASDLAEIAVGAKVFYDQPAGIPAGVLDSNVVLDAGNGDRAVGHCTLDLKTGLGLCTFSDGTGQFTGFSARASVDCTSGSGCRLDGVYRFRNLT
jgi:hypothetical protein